LAAIAEINWPDERDSQMLLAKELAINEEMKLEVHPSPHPSPQNRAAENDLIVLFLQA